MPPETQHNESMALNIHAQLWGLNAFVLSDGSHSRSTHYSVVWVGNVVWVSQGFDLDRYELDEVEKAAPT